MRTRLIALAVLAVAGLTAFAPAPFMKPDRKKDQGDTLDALQGTWTMTEKVRMGPAGQQLNYSTSQKVQIEKDSWRFVSGIRAAKGGKGGGVAKGGGKGGFGGGPTTTLGYKIVLDRKRQPMEFRIKRTTRTETDYMVGILQVRGDTVKMIYRLGSRAALGGDVEEAMPHTFDKAPEGWYSMTLKRDR